MPQESTDQTVRPALADLSRFLSGEIAPLMALDAVQTLLRYPPQLVASQIQTWLASQYPGQASEIPVSDFLYHAMKKLHLMAEFNLIEESVFSRYLDDLGGSVLEICPEGDRKTLRENLGRLGEEEAPLSSTVEYLHRQAGTGQGQGGAEAGGAPAPPEGGGPARGKRRLPLLVERLIRSGKVAASAAGAPPAQQRELVTQALASAALEARSADEFDGHARQLGRLGIDTGPAEIFRLLGQGLPGWVLPASDSPDGPERPARRARSLEAMHRIISMSGGTEKGAELFNEMVQVAIERFNAGELAQAAAMFDLAERLVREKKIGAEVARSIRERAHTELSVEQLRHFLNRNEEHRSLRTVLSFFPAYSVSNMLADLQREEKRESRRFLLKILEVHGQEARRGAVSWLQSCVDQETPDAEGHLQRNLVYLMRRAGRPETATLEQEVALLGQASRWGQPLILIREAIGALGQIKDARAEKALVSCLQEFEGMLRKLEGRGEEAVEIDSLLARTVSALAHQSLPKGRRKVAVHALRQDPSLGDTIARLDPLGTQDLSGDPELVTHLLTNLQKELPAKKLRSLFGGKKRGHRALHLVRSLAGTPLPEVRAALEDSVTRYPGTEVANEASKILSRLGRTDSSDDEASGKLSGDVDLFGLPSLLQSLAESRVTGSLTLTGREEGAGTAVLRLDGGKLRECETGGLRGECAFYQLFESPVPRSFVFSRDPATGGDREGETREILPLMLEALYRHDEFRRARVLVPDDSSLESTEIQPTPLAEEEDAGLSRALWAKAAEGTSPASCEKALHVDSYRVRRLFAHWVEEGSLRPRQPRAAVS